jgi:cytochrome c oxidase subunit 3
MEIPYTVKPREDTGLYNAKVGLWLFIASEIMLFGGLFSSYILLRVGAGEGMWPHGLMNIPIGTFNTVVLITSSVTVVLGWAALKLNNFQKYRKVQGITLLCALGFLTIKSYEYNEKFHHYEVWFNQPKLASEHAELKNQAFIEDGMTSKEKIGTVPSVIGHIEGAGAAWTKKDFEGKEQIVMHLDDFHYRIPARLQAKIKKGDHGHGEAGHEAEGSHGHAELKIPLSEVKRISAFVPAHSTFFAIYFTLTGLHGLHVLAGGIVIFYIWGPGARMWRKDPERYTNRVEVSGLFWHLVDLVWIFLFPVLYLL